MAARHTEPAMLQILLFGVMAVEIKRKAPRAHTVLELVRKRWGHAANIVRPIPHPWLCLARAAISACVVMRIRLSGRPVCKLPLKQLPDLPFAEHVLPTPAVARLGHLAVRTHGHWLHALLPVDAGHAVQVFFYICIINNIFICVLLFLGAGSVFNAATGMSIYACCL